MESAAPAAFVVGREFADGTISGLFALLVARATIAAAKVIVVLVWTAVVAVRLMVAIVAIGVITGHGMPDTDAIDRLARLFVLTVLSGRAVHATVVAASTAMSSLLPNASSTGAGTTNHGATGHR